MENSIVPSSLEISNMTYNEAQYGYFIDIHRPVLTMSEFQKLRNLPLNEQCSSVFYSKIAHLNDYDFVEIDRSILEMIGFKNKVYEVKDKTGAVKVDENGNSKLRDARSDFYQAIRCLRNTAGFVEGTSFDDISAHFVIRKHEKLLLSSQLQHSGHNKQSLWIRKRALEHFILMANTSNSFIIREYFLDLKRVITEYTKYQIMYRTKFELCTKDSSIDELRGNIQELIKKTDKQNQQLEQQNQQLEMQNQQQKIQNQQLKMQNKQIEIQIQQLHMQSQKLEMHSNIMSRLNVMF